MSHHKQIWVGEVLIGHLVITNDRQVLSIVIEQPWGDLEIFYSKYPEVKAEEE